MKSNSHHTTLTLRGRTATNAELLAVLRRLGYIEIKPVEIDWDSMTPEEEHRALVEATLANGMRMRSRLYEKLL